MSLKTTYREIPFCRETRYNDFYIYVNLRDISKKCKDNNLDAVIKCRTLGILHSLNGRFYLTDFNSSGADSEPLIQVSVVYLQVPVQSTLVPYPVQIFGTLQWKNKPVIFAKILQVLTVPTAIRLKNALNCISATHLAKEMPGLGETEQEDIACL